LRVERALLAAMPGGAQFLELPTARLRVRVAGAGPRTFVFAADPPNVIEHYDALVAELSPHARLIVFESPGFGFSRAKGGYDFSIDSQARLVGDLLDSLAAKPAVLAFEEPARIARDALAWLAADVPCVNTSSR
jgi:pimeloyl-ACP methyl ester carboxylesterase